MTTRILSSGIGRKLRSKERQLVAEQLGVPEASIDDIVASPTTASELHQLVQRHRPALVLLPPIVHGVPRKLGFVPSTDSLKLSPHHRVEFTRDGPKLIAYEPPRPARSSYAYAQMEPGIP